MADSIKFVLMRFSFDYIAGRIDSHDLILGSSPLVGAKYHFK